MLVSVGVWSAIHRCGTQNWHSWYWRHSSYSSTMSSQNR